MTIPLRVRGEAGKYLNSIKDPDPRFPYASDIRVRGIWSDKVLAMRYLTARANEHIGLDNGKGSMADLFLVSSHLDNFFDHIVTRDKLLGPVKFRTADGTEYEEKHFELAGTNYQIAETPYPQIARFFGFPDFGRAPLNKILITNAAWFNQTQDPSKGSLSEAFQDSITVFKTRITTPIALIEQKELAFNKFKYIAGKENRVAFTLAQLQETMDQLFGLTPEMAAQIYQVRSAIPEGLDANSKTILEGSLAASDIADFIQGLISLGDNVPPSHAWPPPYDVAVELGIDGLEAVLAIMKRRDTPPETAGPEVKAAYSIDLATLSSFVSGNLQKRTENLEESIQLLFAVP